MKIQVAKGKGNEKEMKKNTSLYFRLIHRYLGFYLAGVMAVYAISGTIMIFRKTDTFKKVTEVETQIKPQLSEKSLGKALKIKNLEITKSIYRQQ